MSSSRSSRSSRSSQKSSRRSSRRSKRRSGSSYSYYESEPEPESEFEYIHDDTDDKCEIISDIIMPRLSISCVDQHKPNGKKCFKNKCLEVNAVISMSDEVSGYGNVVRVNDPETDRNFIVKWNRYRRDLDDFKREVRIQNLAYSYGLAPRIIQFYRQNSSKHSEENGYIYIFMEDLISKGYDTIPNIYGRFKNGKQIGYQGKKNRIPGNVINEITKAMQKLHTIGISHRDVHPGNVFYNKVENKVIFIDFGQSEIHNTPFKALEEEFILSHITDRAIFPSNWTDIIYELWSEYE